MSVDTKAMRELVDEFGPTVLVTRDVHELLGALDAARQTLRDANDELRDVQKDLNATLRELDAARAELAGVPARIEQLLDEGKRGWVAADRTRTVAMEEAARLCDLEATQDVAQTGEYAIRGRKAAGMALAYAIREKADKPPGLVVLPVETVAKVKEALIEADCYLDDRHTSLRSVTDARDALAPLEEAGK